jgi:hypothetical protein
LLQHGHQRLSTVWTFRTIIHTMTNLTSLRCVDFLVVLVRPAALWPAVARCTHFSGGLKTSATMPKTMVYPQGGAKAKSMAIASEAEDITIASETVQQPEASEAVEQPEQDITIASEAVEQLEASEAVEQPEQDMAIDSEAVEPQPEQDMSMPMPKPKAMKAKRRPTTLRGAVGQMLPWGAKSMPKRKAEAVEQPQTCRRP